MTFSPEESQKYAPAIANLMESPIWYAYAAEGSFYSTNCLSHVAHNEQMTLLAQDPDAGYREAVPLSILFAALEGLPEGLLERLIIKDTWKDFEDVYPAWLEFATFIKKPISLEAVWDGNEPPFYVSASSEQMTLCVFHPDGRIDNPHART